MPEGPKHLRAFLPSSQAEKDDYGTDEEIAERERLELNGTLQESRSRNQSSVDRIPNARRGKSHFPKRSDGGVQDEEVE
jgi:hypothetical protein